jgi:anti-sigma-K factor RskA
MISEERQDQAIAYLLAELSPAEQSAFEGELQRDTELQAFVGEMREALGLLAQTAPLAVPPDGLRERILAIAREGIDPVPVPIMEIPRPSGWRAPVAWMAISGALFLIALTVLFDDWTIRAQYALQKEQIVSVKHDLELLQGDVDSQRQQIASMEQADALSQIRVATLDPQIAPLSKASAVVVWNAGKQQGVIKGAHLSGAGPGKDYQLWLIDPSTPGPVSAGVIAVSPDGSFAIAFKPVHSVASVAKFAISVEASGGADSPHGPIVFVGG